jgi:hypothetical protein
MAGVFQNIDPPSPHRPASVYPPPLVRGEDTLARGRGGWGVNILEDGRHSSVLYVFKYFVPCKHVLPKYRKGQCHEIFSLHSSINQCGRE